MATKITNLPDEDHVMRFVPWARLLKDENQNAIGFLPQAFQLRPDEDALSVNWLEYFKGNHSDNIQASVQTFRTTRDVGGKSAFAVGNVAKIKAACAANNAVVRIVHEPEPDNPSHSAIRRLPREDLILLEVLATEAFVDLVKNSDVPDGGAQI